MQFAAFMASGLGRGVRILAGVVLVVVGIYLGGTTGWILGIVGLVPIFVGIVNICLLAPLFGGPLRGTDVAQ